jgi:LysM repeat protein
MKYTLNPEDSIASVCKKFDITPDELIKANGYDNMETFFMEQWGTLCNEIIIPDKVVKEPIINPKLVHRSIIHTVKAEESMFTIAEKYGVSTDDIREWNEMGNLGDYDYLIQGTTLEILVPKANDTVIRYCSETLAIGVDFGGNDIQTLTVGKLEGLKVKITNVFYGEKAQKIYDILTGRSKLDDN